MLNHIVLMGRLTRDPELRRTGSGIAVASFTLAVDRDYAPKDGGARETDFIDIVAWRSTAEFVSFGESKRDSESGGGYSAGNSYNTGNNYGASGGYGSGGYSAPAAPSYAAPSSAPASDFAMLEDDDAQLPF